MSRVHLGHKIPWQDLVECCRIPDPSSVLLPIGTCSLIHIIDKTTKIQVRNRKNYITEYDICTSSTCPTIGKRLFSKEKMLPIHLGLTTRRKCSLQVSKKLVYFSKKLLNSIIEFGKTEEIKSQLEQTTITDNLEHYSENILKNFKLSSYFYSYQIKNDKIVLALFLNCDVKNLLHLNKLGEIDILKAFQQLYGGQAVGRGFVFLMEYHVIPFYLAANAVIAAGYQNESSRWGLLSSEHGFYEVLLYDCDFLTFIPSLRPYLEKDVFMVNLEKTDELLKHCFKYIYIYLLLYQKVYKTSYDQLLRLVQESIESTFRLFRFYE